MDFPGEMCDNEKVKTRVKHMEERVLFKWAGAIDPFDEGKGDHQFIPPKALPPDDLGERMLQPHISDGFPFFYAASITAEKRPVRVALEVDVARTLP